MAWFVCEANELRWFTVLGPDLREGRIQDMAKCYSIRRPRFQFSLVSLLVVVAFISIAAEQLSRPTRIAGRFSQAISEENYPEAEALFVDGGLKLTPVDPRIRKPTAQLEPLTWGDFKRGQRIVMLTRDEGFNSPHYRCVVTRGGVKVRGGSS